MYTDAPFTEALTVEPQKMCLSFEPVSGHYVPEGGTHQSQYGVSFYLPLGVPPQWGCQTALTLATVKYMSGKIIDNTTQFQTQWGCNGFQWVRTQFLVKIKRTPVYFLFVANKHNVHEQMDNDEYSFSPSRGLATLSLALRERLPSLSQPLTERQAGT